MAKPRASRLRATVGNKNFRLSANDQAFLSDLARLTVIDSVSANANHYQDHQTAATSRLDKLVEYGVLKKSTIVEPTGVRTGVYSFASKPVARKFSFTLPTSEIVRGRMPVASVQRTTYHEILVSRAYYTANQPQSFMTEHNFRDGDYRMLGVSRESRPVAKKGERGSAPYQCVSGEAAIPDAMYTDRNGQVVVVEADSGHYTTRQISNKQECWGQFKQLWVQPKTCHAKVQATQGVEVVRY